MKALILVSVSLVLLGCGDKAMDTEDVSPRGLTFYLASITLARGDGVNTLSGPSAVSGNLMLAESGRYTLTYSAAGEGVTVADTGTYTYSVQPQPVPGALTLVSDAGRSIVGEVQPPSSMFLSGWVITLDDSLVVDGETIELELVYTLA